MSEVREELKQQDCVMVANGFGNQPIRCKVSADDTVTSVLERINITLQPDDTVTMSRSRVIHPESTLVVPGDILVVTSKVANGH